MQPEDKSLLASSLAGYDSDWDAWGSKKRRILRGGRILAVAIWSAMAVFLAWTIVADALDVRSGAGKRLVRIDPADLSPVRASTEGGRIASPGRASPSSSTTGGPGAPRRSGPGSTTAAPVNSPPGPAGGIWS